LFSDSSRIAEEEEAAVTSSFSLEKVTSPTPQPTCRSTKLHEHHEIGDDNNGDDDKSNDEIDGNSKW